MVYYFQMTRKRKQQIEKLIKIVKDGKIRKIKDKEL